MACNCLYQWTYNVALAACGHARHVLVGVIYISRSANNPEVYRIVPRTPRNNDIAS
jgi:hypothetical protein